MRPPWATLFLVGSMLGIVAWRVPQEQQFADRVELERTGGTP